MGSVRLKLSFVAARCARSKRVCGRARTVDSGASDGDEAAHVGDVVEGDVVEGDGETSVSVCEAQTRMKTALNRTQQHSTYAPIFSREYNRRHSPTFDDFN